MTTRAGSIGLPSKAASHTPQAADKAARGREADGAQQF
jgi:hypothetical protein